MDFPNRSDVERVLVALADGTMTVRAADRWAAPFFVQESGHPDAMDHVVWDALQHLFGADLEQSPGRPLHDQADFAAWLAEFRAKASE